MLTLAKMVTRKTKHIFLGSHGVSSCEICCMLGRSSFASKRIESFDVIRQGRLVMWRSDAKEITHSAPKIHIFTTSHVTLMKIIHFAFPTSRAKDGADYRSWCIRIAVTWTAARRHPDVSVASSGNLNEPVIRQEKDPEVTRTAGCGRNAAAHLITLML